MTTDEYREDYEELRDRIIDRLNPPDDDIGEVAIMLTALDSIANYVEGLPCTCTPEAIDDYQEFACGRCQVLGRVGDVVTPR